MDARKIEQLRDLERRMEILAELAPLAGRSDENDEAECSRRDSDLAKKAADMAAKRANARFRKSEAAQARERMAVLREARFQTTLNGALTRMTLEELRVTLVLVRAGGYETTGETRRRLKTLVRRANAAPAAVVPRRKSPLSAPPARTKRHGQKIWTPLI